MAKYYILLFLIAGIVLFYIYSTDPCNEKLRMDFSNEHPDYKILDSGSGEGSVDNVHCHIYYLKPDSDQIYEDIWLYQNSDDGWNFSRILETREREYVP